MSQDYKIEDGGLIARYNLIGINKKNCIYASNFGAIINEEHVNDLFLKKFKSKYKNPKILNNASEDRIRKIKILLVKLNNKYRFLSIAELNHLKKSSNDKKNVFDFLSKTENVCPISRLSKLDKILSSVPIMLPAYKTTITSHYGPRKHPVTRRRSFHYGIDLIGHKSCHIYSAADGVVTKVGRVNGYGNIIEITHSGKFTSKYAHLNKISVIEGSRVLKGEKIGTQGNSGNSTGEHLHFEIWLNGKQINPFDFISHACNC